MTLLCKFVLNTEERTPKDAEDSFNLYLVRVMSMETVASSFSCVRLEFYNRQLINVRPSCAVYGICFSPFLLVEVWQFNQYP
jgi:hypothetical protein